MENKKRFSSRVGGFKLLFENNLILSVQFSGGNYCENNSNLNLLTREFNSMEFISSENCEIAIIDNKTKRFVTKKILGRRNEDVLGYVSFERFLQILDIVKKYGK